MRADEFERLFDEHVRQPAIAAGWEPWGKSRIRIAHGSVHAALVRSELRFTWPFALTFLATHAGVRDLHGDVTDFPREPTAWIVKAHPADLRRWRLREWTYQPHNLSVPPRQEMTDHGTAGQLGRVGSDLVAITPRLEELFSARRLLAQLQAHGEGAWCESSWSEDLAQQV